MEQKSNVQYRAEKEYKNSREKFSFLLREIISNSIHAVLIRKNKEDNYTPEVHLKILFDEDQCQIELKDNGEGFTEDNIKYFDELDAKNREKEQLNFHPLGQGRLAIVYFSDFAEYETVYRDKQNVYKKRIIPYPNTGSGLFSCSLFSEETLTANDTYTVLKIIINKQNSYGRAKTFFKRHPTSSDIKKWFIETFFPFIVNNDDLTVFINFNNEKETINKDSIEKEIEPLPFDVTFQYNGKHAFQLWIIKKDGEMRGESPIDCFARNLKADLVEGKISYLIDNPEGFLFYLTSEYFDEYVNTKGDKIEITYDDVEKINQEVNRVLDDKFKSIIQRNQRKTKQNLDSFKKKYPSLEPFINEENVINGKGVLNGDEIVKKAVDEKSRIEKKFWTHIDDYQGNDGNESFDDSEECHKLINSSLHIYVKHRDVVLNKLHDLLPFFKEGAEEKPELESTVHELFFRRGTTLKDSSNINHLHNLWILDDKFTTFSNDFQAKSTKSGQPLSDIYLWADHPEKTKQVLIFELKSTTKAHNAGDSKEGMIAQIRRYAKDFYMNPTKVLNWDVDTEKVQYTGIILARKSDINKELTSNSVGRYYEIPFLSNSFFLDDEFSKGNEDPRNKKAIRIELYSFEDIYDLASDRNKVFSKLLKNEFTIQKEEFNE